MHSENFEADFLKMASATHATFRSMSHPHLFEKKRDLSIKITSGTSRFETCRYLKVPNFKLRLVKLRFISWEWVAYCLASVRSAGWGSCSRVVGMQPVGTVLSVWNVFFVWCLQECAPGHYRSRSSPYLGICVKCNCNGHSDDCDVVTGECFVSQCDESVLKFIWVLIFHAVGVIKACWQFAEVYLVLEFSCNFVLKV